MNHTILSRLAALMAALFLLSGCVQPPPARQPQTAPPAETLQVWAPAVSEAPITTPTPTPTPAEGSQPAADARYILNTNTHKFHLPGCSSVNRMKEENKRDYTGSRDELIYLGYSPCQRCFP